MHKTGRYAAGFRRFGPPVAGWFKGFRGWVKGS